MQNGVEEKKKKKKGRCGVEEEGVKSVERG